MNNRRVYLVVCLCLASTTAIGFPVQQENIISFQAATASMADDDIVFFIQDKPIGPHRSSYPDMVFRSQSPWFCLFKDGTIVYLTVDSVKEIVYFGRWYQKKLSLVEQEALWQKIYEAGLLSFNPHSVKPAMVTAGTITTIGIQTNRVKKILRFSFLPIFAEHNPENQTLQKTMKLIESLMAFQNDTAQPYFSESIYLWLTVMGKPLSYKALQAIITEEEWQKTIPPEQDELKKRFHNFLKSHIKQIPSRISGTGLAEYRDYDPYKPMEEGERHKIEGPLARELMEIFAKHDLVGTEIDGTLYRLLYRPVFERTHYSLIGMD